MEERVEWAGQGGGRVTERGFKLHILKQEKDFINNNYNNGFRLSGTLGVGGIKKRTKRTARRGNIILMDVFGITFCSHKSYLSFRMTHTE